MTDTASMTERQGRAARGGSPSVFVVAGEASGDWAGALLVDALRRRRPGLQVGGIGGRRMAAAGVDLVADSSEWGAIGVFDAVRKIPRIHRAFKRLQAQMAEAEPEALVLIDSGGMNVPLARRVRKQGLEGLKIVYYLPPGSWSRKPRSQGVRELVEAIATPFPWSRDLLAGGPARVEWVGHPVLESARPQISREAALRRYGIEAERPVIALAPGSRDQEMRYVLPVLAAGAGRLRRELPGAQFLVPVSDPVYEKRVWEAFRREGVEVMLLRGMEYDALQLAGAAAVCSGTATLEFACLCVPMTIVYKASPANTAQFLLFRGIIGGQWQAGMPNIIAGRVVARELLWRYATPEAVAGEVGRLLEDEGYRAEAERGLAEVVRSLGEAGASERTAELVLKMMGRPQAEP